MATDNNMPASIVDAQVQRLLEVVEEYRQQQCNTLLEQAGLKSRKIIHQTYRNARLRLHHDIQESRLNMQKELAATRAKQHTLMMKRKHQQDQLFLDRAWDALGGNLQERGRNPEQRQLWVQNIVNTALKVLPGQDWAVSHPADWSSAEQDEFKRTVSVENSRVVSFVSVPDITAGIRISADAALVDGTVQGLMVAPARIESELLAQRKNVLVRRHKDNQQ